MTLLNLVQSLLPTATPSATPSSTSVSNSFAQLSEMSLEQMMQKLSSLSVDFVIKLVTAIVVFYIGRFLVKRIYVLVKAIMIKRKVELSLATFLLSLMEMLLFFILIIIVIGILGIETSSFIALFASAGVAIGMALSGTLQNFAGGVLILLLKPYKVGDYIKMGETEGYVKAIQIFFTILTTFDNKTQVVPNGLLSSSTVTNFSGETCRRLEWDVSISYGDDIDKAREAMVALLTADERVVNHEIAAPVTENDDEPSTEMEDKPLPWWKRVFHKHRKLVQKASAIEQMELPIKNPVVPPAVYVSALSDSKVIVRARAWVRSADYWPVFYHFNEAFYKELPKHGIHFPFPQLDVHLNPTNT